MGKIIKCFFCDNPADRLGYYSKFYPTQKSTIENPTLFCKNCWDRHRLEIYTSRGGIEGVYCFLFPTIGNWSGKEVGYYTNEKGWERNDLSSLGMKKLIWRIKFLQSKKKG